MFNICDKRDKVVTVTKYYASKCNSVLSCKRKQAIRNIYVNISVSLDLYLKDTLNLFG